MLRSGSFYNFLVFGIPILMFAALGLIATSSLFRENAEALSIGITIDLLVCIPLVYFLLIRKTRIPKTTIIPVLILGLVVGKLILPGQHHFYLDLFKKWMLPFIELSVLGFVIYKVTRAVKSFKITDTGEKDFYDHLKDTCKDIIPGYFVIPVVTEIAVFYYGFVNWRKHELKENEFHYHKESGSVPLLAVIIFLIFVETIVLHILLALWNETIAWILTLLSIYSLIQIFGIMRSLSKRPAIIGKEKLYLRYGIMKETEIDLNNIDSIEISDRDIELDADKAKLSLLGNLESHNLLLHLKNRSILNGPYGKTTSFKTLAFQIDDKVAFKNKIEAILNCR